ncbi:MAG: DUF3307 domain-containing protein [Verrucomicrobiales bacterium]
MIPPWLPSDNLSAAAILFFAFIIGHALGDYPLQTDFMARGKNRHLPQICEELPVRGLWVYLMTAHALTHAGIVWILSGCPLLAVGELVLHWTIDWLKVERKINFHLDQTMHILCKAAYVAILLATRTSAT